MIAAMSAKKASTPQPSPSGGRRSKRMDPFSVERYREWAKTLEIVAAEFRGLAENGKRASIAELQVDGAQGQMEDVFAILKKVRDNTDDAIVLELRKRTRPQW